MLSKEVDKNHISTWLDLLDFPSGLVLYTNWSSLRILYLCYIEGQCLTIFSLKQLQNACLSEVLLPRPSISSRLVDVSFMAIF
jgi:hypothetical protein